MTQLAFWPNYWVKREEVEDVPPPLTDDEPGEDDVDEDDEDEEDR